MKSLLRRTGLVTGYCLLVGVIGCGPELSMDGVSTGPASALETQAAPLTVDPAVGAALPAVGGSLGVTFSDSCPAGYVGTGLNIRSATWVERVQLICRKLNLDGTLGATATTVARGGDSGTPASGSCDGEQIMSGQLLGATGSTGDDYVGQVGALCSTATRLKNATGGSDSTLTPLGALGSATPTACEAGQAVTGIFGRSAQSVNQLGFKCSKLNDVKSTFVTSQGINMRVSNVQINGAGQSTTVAAGRGFTLKADYSISSPGCPSCINKIIVGWVSSDPSVPQQPWTCLNKGVLPSGTNSVVLPAPSRPGTYTLRVHYAQSTQCDLNWWYVHGNGPGPDAIIGEFQVN